MTCVKLSLSSHSGADFNTPLTRTRLECQERNGTTSVQSFIIIILGFQLWVDPLFFFLTFSVYSDRGYTRTFVCVTPGPEMASWDYFAKRKVSWQTGVNIKYLAAREVRKSCKAIGYFRPFAMRTLMGKTHYLVRNYGWIDRDIIHFPYMCACLHVQDRVAYL